MPNTRTIGFVASYKSGLTALQKAGQEQRLLDKYVKPYLEKYETVYYFSYFPENIADFTEDPELRKRVHILPKRWNIHPALYGLLMPMAYWKEFKDCSVFRVFQATGILPFLGPWAYRAKCLVTFGYSYSGFASVERKSRWKVWALAIVERLAAWRADIALVTTQTLYVQLRAWRKTRPVVLIPNGVDLDQFRPQDEQRTPQKTKTILFIGRLEEQKNLANLIRGAAQVHKDIPIRLLWIGEGTQKESLKALAADHHLPLTIQPPVPHTQLPEVMRSADVFALVSHIEGHPKILLEAMSAGMPCVVSDCEGNRELAAGGDTAFTCFSQDVQTIAHALTTALIEKEAARAKTVKARKMIEERFSLRQHVQEEIAQVLSLASAPAPLNMFLHMSFVFLAAAFFGSILLDKEFAYIGIPPIYITDILLSLSLVTLLLSGRAYVPKIPGKTALVLLLSACSFSWIRGVIIYGLSDAMRDVMIIGYILAGYLTLQLGSQIKSLSPKFLKFMTSCAFLFLAARLAGVIGNLFFNTDLPLQPACSAIYISGMLILVLHQISTKRTVFYYGAQILLVTLGILLSVRSAWLAWILISVTVLSLRMKYVLLPNFRSFLLRVIPSSLALALVLSTFNPSRLLVPMLSDMETILAFLPSHGGSSSLGNVRTRYWMWLSALEEMTKGTSSEQQSKEDAMAQAFNSRSEKLVEISPHLANKFRMVSNLNLWEHAQNDPMSGWAVPLKPGLKRSVVEFSKTSWIRMLFGFPMGKLFIPPRVSHWLDVPRFDPHNSLIAVWYRTGTIGLIGFLVFMITVLRATVHRLRTATSNSMPRNIWIFAFLFTLYCAYHMLSDVVLESPFKSIFFWGSLGLCLIPPAPSPAADNTKT